MKHWMEYLGLHYKKIRDRYENERLIIVFDIDGTILDMRFIIHYVLRQFDKDHGTEYFTKIKISDIDFHEAHLRLLLNRLSISYEDQRYILSYYENMFLSTLTIKKANKPYRGVFEIIKWFQMQSNTFVGLNTGRPESLRFKTLSSLNLLGKDQGVQFSNRLLFMNNMGLDGNIPHIKKRGIEYFQKLGYKVFAFVDNEPENLKAVAEIDRRGEILLLH
ncbi:MAG: HAD family hydrolase, partial [Syntrophorhabdaceae bacterium]|nr:HAD family hydrolase [Syntrophorhabdaceae bacterium]